MKLASILVCTVFLAVSHLFVQQMFQFWRWRMKRPQKNIFIMLQKEPSKKMVHKRLFLVALV